MPAGRRALQADHGIRRQADLGEKVGHIGGKPGCNRRQVHSGVECRNRIGRSGIGDYVEWFGEASAEHQWALDRNHQVGRRDVTLEQRKAPVVGGVPEAHRVGQHAHVKTVVDHGRSKSGQATGA